MSRAINLVDVLQAATTMPYHAGYHPSPGQYAMVVYDSDARRVLSGVMEPMSETGLSPRAVADHLTNVITAVDGDQVLMIGYGPAGAASAASVGEQLRNTMPTRPVDLSVVEHDLEQGRFRFATAAGSGIELDDLLHWYEIPEVNDVASLAAGFPAPAADRAALKRQYEPLEQPTFEPLSTTTAAELDAQSPTFRVDLVRSDIDRIRNTRPKQDISGPMARLAHLVRDPIVRDATMRHLMVDPPTEQTASTVEALVQTYRGAPPIERNTIGGMAAAVGYANHMPFPGVQTIIEHCPLSSLADLVQQVAITGISPSRLRELFTESYDPGALAAAEARWQSARDSASGRHPGDLSKLSYPAPAQDGLKSSMQPPSMRPGTSSPRERGDSGRTR